MLVTLYQLPTPVNLIDSAKVGMKCMTQYTVQLAKEVVREFKPSSRRTSAHKNGYSAEFMLRKWHLCLVFALKRHMYGLQGKVVVDVAQTDHPWDYIHVHHTACSCVEHEAQECKYYAHLEWSGGGEAFWTSFPAKIVGDVRDRQIDSLRKALQGRKRLKMRKAATGYTTLVEQMLKGARLVKLSKLPL